MHRAVIAGAVIGLLCMSGLSYGQPCPAETSACRTEDIEKAAPTPLETILEGLQKKAGDLKSYECKIDYVVRQSLLESMTRRTGMLYYAKYENRSHLRIDFLTLQQDEEPQQEYREQFIFDGVWLRHISYQTRSVERRQIAEPNQPVDAFSLASRHVPVFGFAKVEDLHEQFEIELVPQEGSEPSPYHHLHLKVKPQSIYRDDYKTIDFWVDKKVGLPATVHAVGAEADVGDLYEIKLLTPKVNEGIDKSVFEVSVPRNFSVETIPLEKQQGRK